MKSPRSVFVINRLIPLIIVAASLSACQTIDPKTQWPENIPAKSLFIEEYNRQAAAGANNEPLDSHLRWVIKFYQGSVLYPVGWNDMIELVTNSFDAEEDKQRADKRLRELGFKICVEWAQSNSERNIDSSNIAIWGSALRTSVERKEQFAFMDRVEVDVDDLIARKLSARDIKRDRYYPPEDYDNF